MKFNLDNLYQIESGASHKKIYRFKNQNKGKVAVDFSYNHEDYLAFLEVNNFLSSINISSVIFLISFIKTFENKILLLDVIKSIIIIIFISFNFYFIIIFQ